MAPWAFFLARTGSPRAATTPEAIDDGMHTFPGDHTGFADDSDNDNDFNDLRLPAPPFAFTDSPTSKKAHSRSLSGNLNSLFGGRRRTPSNPTTPGPTTGSSPPIHDGSSSPRPKTARQAQENDTEQTGSCATCASKVKWPAGVTEFRCGTCLMINDTEPRHKRSLSPKRPGQAFARAGTFPGNGPDRRGKAAVHMHSTPVLTTKGLPLSLERTSAIINRCLDDFLLEMHHTLITRTNASGVAPPLPQPNTHDPSSPSSASGDLQSRIPARSYQSQVVTLPEGNMRESKGDAIANSTDLDRLRTAQTRLIKRSAEAQPKPARHVSTSENAPRPPSRRPPPPPLQPVPSAMNVIARKPIPGSLAGQNAQSDARPDLPMDSRSRSDKYIFKALEDYVISTFGRYGTLNRSFSSSRPRPRPVAQSEDNLRSVGNASSSLLFDGYDAEIDAKTLLLGDVAENGLWWAGKDRPSRALEARPPPELSSGFDESLVGAKSPHIQWTLVSEWYSLVIRCGESWQRRVRELEQQKKFDVRVLLDQAQAIDASLTEARLHVQKTLLKASETLLKRPGQPLKEPSDTRFLLILLANPLLYPSTSSPLLDHASDNAKDKSNGAPLQGQSIPPSRPGHPAGYWERGHAFGILKRSLGLMSNMPNESHRFLTSCFARYDETRFMDMVALIQSFVTHRLSQQHATKRKDTQNSSNLVPQVSGTGTQSSAQLHAALGLSSPKKATPERVAEAPPYIDDWQIKSAARVMSLFFSANKAFRGERTTTRAETVVHPGSISRQSIKHHGQLLSTSDFYNLKADYCDLIADFETWEMSKTKFSICQYPFFFSVGSKIRILEHDAQRQMSVKAREAFFNSILHNKDLKQYLYLKVRRGCLVEDSLTAISQTVAQGEGEFKKGLRVQFTGEEGIDAGGLRKEWFLLLVREIFDPEHGMFIYDAETNLCYFNPHTFEASEQYFLVGALLGLAIYNLTILDVALPPFLFKKLLASGASTGQQHAYNRTPMRYTLDELSELRPSLARGLQQLLDFDGDVQETYCRDFVIEVERFGTSELVPLGINGASRHVTNSNRQEFVDLYVRYLLDTQVARQYEPFKRGFFTVCGGNALSLFQPEEIELLVRGSDEPLDVPSLKAVAIYENWRRGDRKVDSPAEEVNLIQWFWEFLESAEPKAQRRVLGFITGSDRIPAMGAMSLVIKIGFAGKDHNRFPIARTCFNSLLLYKYRSREELVDKLWRAVTESEGFGLK